MTLSGFGSFWYILFTLLGYVLSQSPFLSFGLSFQVSLTLYKRLYGGSRNNSDENWYLFFDF